MPIVAFDFNPINGNTLVIFNFIDQYDNDGTVEEWLWDFGDGNTSLLQNPSHNFSLPGTYYVNLTVIDDQNGANYTMIITILVDNTINSKDSYRRWYRNRKRVWALPSDKHKSRCKSIIDNLVTIYNSLWKHKRREFTGDNNKITHLSQERMK